MTLPTTSSWKEWHYPLSDEEETLREVRDNLAKLGAEQDDIPLMIQLVENPRYDIPGFDLFHGAVDLETHDLIHILLGRGLLPEDEAFVIGFTMGSTNRVSTTEERLFSLVSRYLYPRVYQFRSAALEIFRDAVKLGFISDCQPLNDVDYAPLLDASPAQARETLGIETELLSAYYSVEAKRYPESVASRRLKS